MNARIEIERDIVERYRRMADASSRMLTAARDDDWDRVCLIEKDCAGIVAELSTIGDLSPSDPELRQQKIALMRRVLADDAAIRQLSEPWMAKLDAMMRNAGNVGRVQRAYGAGHFGG